MGDSGSKDGALEGGEGVCEARARGVLGRCVETFDTAPSPLKLIRRVSTIPAAARAAEGGADTNGSSGLEGAGCGAVKFLRISIGRGRIGGLVSSLTSEGIENFLALVSSVVTLDLLSLSELLGLLLSDLAVGGLSLSSPSGRHPSSNSHRLALVLGPCIPRGVCGSSASSGRSTVNSRSKGHAVLS